MVKRLRPSGPAGTVRPFSPLPPTEEPIEQIAQALDHIAVSLAGIDHNLEHAAAILRAIALKQGALSR